MRALPLPGVSSILGDETAGHLDRAVRAVLAGGAAAMRFHRTDELSVDDMGKGPVTEADRASNRVILDVLGSDLPVLSEESRRSRERIGAERLWVVDPLDGTREFIDGIDEFSVMVGMAGEEGAVLGAVYRPVPDRLYVGIVEQGAWEVSGLGSGDEDPVVRQLSANREPGDRIRMVRSRSHPDPRLVRLEETLDDVEVILCGSAGTKCALVAADRADLYVHPVPYLKEWDTCAPEAVARGSGARVTDWSGRRLEYGKEDPRQPRGIFAATPIVYERVADTVRRIVDETPCS